MGEGDCAPAAGAPVQGYVGVGFPQTEGQMSPADAVIGWMDGANGQPQVRVGMCVFGGGRLSESCEGSWCIGQFSNVCCVSDYTFCFCSTHMSPGDTRPATASMLPPPPPPAPFLSLLPQVSAYHLVDYSPAHSATNNNGLGWATSMGVAKPTPGRTLLCFTRAVDAPGAQVVQKLDASGMPPPPEPPVCPSMTQLCLARPFLVPLAPR